MNEATFNPDDLAFLASCSLDGDLSDEDRKRLADALEGSESLRVDTDAMREVRGLVSRWANAPVEIDWDAHAELIVARCRGNDAQDQPELDRVLKRWAHDDTPIDDEQYTAEVMHRVESGAWTSPKRPRRQWMFRLAVPLAAAAALAFALIGGSWMNRDIQRQDFVGDVRPESALDASRAPICIVRFAREALNESAEALQSETRRDGGISFTTFGLATIGVATMPPGP